MKVCFQCGQAIKEQMKFCSNCGAPQNQSQESPVEKIIFNRTDDIDIQFTEQFFLALKIRMRAGRPEDLPNTRVKESNRTEIRKSDQSVIKIQHI